MTNSRINYVVMDFFILNCFPCVIIDDKQFSIKWASYWDIECIVLLHDYHFASSPPRKSKVCWRHQTTGFNHGNSPSSRMEDDSRPETLILQMFIWLILRPLIPTWTCQRREIVRNYIYLISCTEDNQFPLFFLDTQEARKRRRLQHHIF